MVARYRGAAIVVHAGDGNEFGKLYPASTDAAGWWTCAFLPPRFPDWEREGFASSRASAMRAAKRSVDQYAEHVEVAS